MDFKLLPAFIAFLFIFLALSSPHPSKASENSGGKIISHAINVTIDLKEHTLSGSDILKVKNETAGLRLFINRAASIEKISSDGEDLDFTTEDFPKYDAKALSLKLPASAPTEERIVEVRYSIKFPDITVERDRIKRGVSYVESGVMGEEGAFLPSSSLWYPQEENGALAAFDASVSSPEGYSTVMEGEWIKKASEQGKSTDRWRTEHPLDGLDLVMAKYVIDKESYKGIDIYTFFFEKDEKLSRLYIDKTKGYLDLYQDTIGPYPFKKFAVVESFLPTGYGMPSFTLLGSSVIKLPFIPDTSLGHEIAHNWWGNSVFMDNSLGNWSEAITTYTADYKYVKIKDGKEAADFRLSKLRGYKSFAGPDAIALKDFTDSTSPSTRAVGYNKGLMVFNMLNRHLGDGIFNKAIKEFYSSFALKRASWADIQDVFEKVSGEDLNWFFKQWVIKAGAPSLSIEDASVKESGKGYAASFKLRQKNQPYILDLPVLFTTEKGDVWKEFRVAGEVEELSFELDSKPISMEIDPGYEVFRFLSDEEVPPSFGAFFGDKNGVFVVPNQNRFHDKYIAGADMLARDFSLELTTDADIGKKDYLKGRSIFIFGGPGENALAALEGQVLSSHVTQTGDSYIIDGKQYPRSGTILAVAAKEPHDPAKTICFLMGNSSKEKVTEAAKRLRYFGEYSFLIFTGNGKPEKGTFEGKKSLKIEFGK